MTCPKCNGETLVSDSRSVDQGSSVRRRRTCQTCNHRFTTYEDDVDSVRETRVTVNATELTRAIRVALRDQKSTVVIRGRPTAKRGGI